MDSRHPSPFDQIAELCRFFQIIMKWDLGMREEGFSPFMWHTFGFVWPRFSKEDGHRRMHKEKNVRVDVFYLLRSKTNCESHLWWYAPLQKELHGVSIKHQKLQKYRRYLGRNEPLKLQKYRMYLGRNEPLKLQQYSMNH